MTSRDVRNGIGVGVLVIVGIILLALVGIGMRYFLAAPSGAAEASEQIRSGSFRIAAYDHFFDLCASIQADEGRLAALNAELEGEITDERASQVRASITAVTSSRAEKIANYNADARKDWTAGQFRDSDLPYRLYVTDEETLCESF